MNVHGDGAGTRRSGGTWSRMWSMLGSILVVGALLSTGPLRAAPPGYPSSVDHRPDRVRFEPGETDELRDLAERHGRVHALVQLDVDVTPSGELGRAAADRQRRAIRSAQDEVLSALEGTDFRLKHRYDITPTLAVSLPPAAVEALRNHPRVQHISLDLLARPALSGSVPHVEADQLHAKGEDGSGGMVVVLDTGMDTDHPALGGRVVQEACFSQGADGDPTTGGDCPDGTATQFGTPAGRPIPVDGVPDTHGTHVGGIAAGQATTVPSSPLSDGVARGADVGSIMVFFEGTHPTTGDSVALSWVSDQIAGLEHVRDSVNASHNVVAVNMSLAVPIFDTSCDGTFGYKPVVDDLRSVGVVTVAGTGNSGDTDAVAAPACVSSTVAVGATQTVTSPESIASFSNQDPDMVDLVAPGVLIRSAAPGDAADTISGTSMAAPHVAGGWVVLHQATGAGVGLIEQALIDTGDSITDNRPGAPSDAVYRSIRLAQADTTIRSVGTAGGGGAGAAEECLIERFAPARAAALVRRARDAVLLTNRPGRALAKRYYESLPGVD